MLDGAKQSHYIIIYYYIFITFLKNLETWKSKYEWSLNKTNNNN